MKKLFTLLMVMLSLLLWGCSGNEDKDIDNPDKGGNEKPENVALDLSVTDLVFEATGGKKEFIVRSNTDWTIENTSSWCQISTDKGRTDEAVTVSVSAYTGMEDRNTNLTVKSGTTTKILSVTQKRKDAIVLSKDKFDVPQEGGQVDIEVKSNIQYEVTIPSEYKDWIKEAVKSKAVETKNFSFTISANEDYSKRDGYIVFEGNGVKDTVRIYQAQIDQLILTKVQCNIPSSEQTLEVELRTNVDYNVIVPDSVSGWISVIQTKAIRTDKVNLSIGKNKGYDSRNAVIIFKDKNSELTDTLRIKQAQKNAIILGQKKYDLPQVGGNITVEVQSNIQYQVTIPTKFQSWIKRSWIKSKALETRNFSFIISANGEVEQREGYIVFEGNSIKDTVKILQEADTRKLILSNLSYLVPAEGKKVEIQLRTNIDFEVVIPDSVSGWISILQTRAMRTEYVNLVIAPNELSKKRDAVVIFKDKGSNLSDTVIFSQTPNPILTIKPKSLDISQDGGDFEINVESNLDYNVIIPDSVAKWISVIQTKAIRAENVNLQIKASREFNRRQAVVIFKEKEGNSADTLRIRQAQRDTILFFMKKIDVSYRGDNVPVQVKSNVDYSVSIPIGFQTWIEQKQVANTSSGRNYLYTISENKDCEKRTGYILFSGASLKDTVWINQKAAPRTLVVESKNREAEPYKHIIPFFIKTNVDYEVIIPEEAKDWAKAEIQASKNLDIWLEANRKEERQVTIIVKDKGSDLSETITIRQKKDNRIFRGNKTFSNTTEIELFFWNDNIGVDGNVTIQNCNSLSGFNRALEYISGTLTIKNCTFTTFRGMENVDYLGGIKIENSPVESFQGLEKVTKIGTGGIEWDTRCLITSFEGLNNLTEIIGKLYVNSYTLESFKGLESLTEIGGDVWIHGSLGYNCPLQSLQGLNNLKKVGFGFAFFYCDLKSLDGLNNLEYVHWNLTFRVMDKLKDISALSNLKYVGDMITIADDPMLYDFTPLKNIMKNFDEKKLFILGNGYNPTKEQILNGQGKPQQ